MLFTMLLFLLSNTQTPETTVQICSGPVASAAERELCLGEDGLKRADAMAEGAERSRTFEAAADRYRRASDLGTSAFKLIALSALAKIYDTSGLNQPSTRESVLRELTTLAPNNPEYLLELATHQERHNFVEAAEMTLLDARQRHPSFIDVYKRLAQFYARRVTALNASSRELVAAELPNPGEPDKDGIYQIGPQLPPPRREGVAVYPEDAKAAGIKGAVQTELVIDEAGMVVAARVLKSIPLLDEAALAAVREWRFTPTIVKGKPVPVKMTVMVTFTQ